MSTIVIQRQPMLASIVAQLSNCSEIALCARHIITKIIRSPINSNEGSKLSLNTPLNNPASLNILRPAVLRQYHEKNLLRNAVLKNQIKRYTYGSSSGTSSVGMEKYNFVTRPMGPSMEKLSSDVHTFLTQNQKHFNLETMSCASNS